MGANRPGASSFLSPFHHLKGAGVSTFREGEKARAHRTTIHCARDATLAIKPKLPSGICCAFHPAQLLGEPTW